MAAHRAMRVIADANVLPAGALQMLVGGPRDLPALLETQLSKHSRLPSWFNPGILTAARLFYGLRTEELVPIKAAASWGDRPLLLIHGESDSTVPVAQALRLSRAAGASCKTLTLPGVEHVQAYNSDPEQYVDLIAGFFHDHLSP